jgi:hypothetical protein
MTISTLVNNVAAQGNGVTTAFSYSFLIPQASNAVVVHTDLTGTQTVLSPSQYTLSGVGNPNGGTITYPLSGVMAVGELLTLKRVLPLQQLTSLVNQSGYYPAVVEAALDNLEMQIQQISTGNQSIQFPSSDSNTLNAILPPASLRANRVLSFDAFGNVQATGAASTTQVYLDMANTASLSLGAGLMGFNSGLVYLAGTVGGELLTLISSTTASTAALATINAGRSVNTIALLRAVSKTAVQHCWVTGYYAQGDGGGGNYWYDSTDSSSSDNGGTIIVASDGGRWKLQLAHPVTVLQFGAKGDGVTDDGAAFQAALNWANSIGGGIVHVPVKVYFFGSSSALVVGHKVQLKGMAEGPFDGSSTYGSAPWGPTMLVTNTTNVFVTLNGFAAKVMDLLFYYPNQVAPTASTPTSYPWTIEMYGGESFTAQAVTGCTIVNCYQGIYVLGAVRSRISDCIIGCFYRGIQIDECVDWFELHNIDFQVIYDSYVGLAYPQTIDTYVLNNYIALTTLRVDSLQASNLGVFSAYAFHQCTDSGVSQPGVKCGYGRFVNIDADTVAYGVIAVSTNSPGFNYTNFCIGANNSGLGTPAQSAAYTVAGGTMAPTLTFSNGSVRGSWANGAGFPFQFGNAGQIYTESCRGIQPAGINVAQPAFPTSGNSFLNPYTFPVQIAYSCPNASGIAINGVGVHAPIAGVLVLSPGQSITFTYSGGSNSWSLLGL